MRSRSPTRRSSASSRSCMSSVRPGSRPPSTAPSLAQEVGLARLDGVEQVEHVEHDRERDRGLGRREDDREDREHLPVELHRAEAVERDEVDVRGVQDHLDPHQDVDDVAPGQDRDDPEGEERGGHRDIGAEAYHAVFHQDVSRALAGASGSKSAFLRRAMYTAATSATVSTTAASSNATTYWSAARNPTPMRRAEPTSLSRPSSGAPRTNQCAERATWRPRKTVAPPISTAPASTRESRRSPRSGGVSITANRISARIPPT